MKIVVLDGYTANPGDLSWDGLERLGELTVYDRTRPECLLARAEGAEVLLTNKVVIGREAMAALPLLRYIGVLATGYNVVDVGEAHRRGIAVTNIPAYSTMSVAQMVMAHLLNIVSQVALHAEAVRQGEWQQSPDFSFTKAPLTELDGLTMGIVGLGNIGGQVARMAQAFGMKVTAVSSKPEETLRTLGIRKAADCEQLFREADVVSLHCPLTKETHHLVNRKRLALMKPSAILINTGRGPLIDEEALAEALSSGALHAAGIDVCLFHPVNCGLMGMEADLTTDAGTIHIREPIPGIHNLFNAGAAACVGRALGLTNEEIAAGIAAVKTIAGRLNMIPLKDDIIVIDDCYNANPKSMCAAIDTLGYALGRKIAILGDMFELGEESDKLHGEVGDYAASCGVDSLIFVGASAKHMYERARLHDDVEIRYYPNKELLLSALSDTSKDILRQGDTILVKASHGMGFSEVVDFLNR